MRFSDLFEAFWRAPIRAFYSALIAVLSGVLLFLLIVFFFHGKNAEQNAVPKEQRPAAESPAPPVDDNGPRAKLRAKLGEIAVQPDVRSYRVNQQHVLPGVTVIVETEVNIQNPPSASSK